MAKTIRVSDENAEKLGRLDPVPDRAISKLFGSADNGITIMINKALEEIRDIVREVVREELEKVRG
jgi:hypothetical protein